MVLLVCIEALTFRVARQVAFRVVVTARAAFVVPVSAYDCGQHYVVVEVAQIGGAVRNIGLDKFEHVVFVNVFIAANLYFFLLLASQFFKSLSFDSFFLLLVYKSGELENTLAQFCAKLLQVG